MWYIDLWLGAHVTFQTCKQDQYYYDHIYTSDQSQRDKHAFATWPARVYQTVIDFFGNPAGAGIFCRARAGYASNSVLHSSSALGLLSLLNDIAFSVVSAFAFRLSSHSPFIYSHVHLNQPHYLSLSCFPPVLYATQISSRATLAMHSSKSAILFTTLLSLSTAVKGGAVTSRAYKSQSGQTVSTIPFPALAPPPIEGLVRNKTGANRHSCDYRFFSCLCRVIMTVAL